MKQYNITDIDEIVAQENGTMIVFLNDGSQVRTISIENHDGCIAFGYIYE